MTLQQVEQVLGKPVQVVTLPPGFDSGGLLSVPAAEVRHYPGDGGLRIFVWFDGNGVAIGVQQEERKQRRGFHVA
jgi:hypothetical protein